MSIRCQLCKQLKNYYGRSSTVEERNQFNFKVSNGIYDWITDELLLRCEEEIRRNSIRKFV